MNTAIGGVATCLHRGAMLHWKAQCGAHGNQAPSPPPPPAATADDDDAPSTYRAPWRHSVTQHVAPEKCSKTLSHRPPLKKRSIFFLRGENFRKGVAIYYMCRNCAKAWPWARPRPLCCRGGNHAAADAAGPFLDQPVARLVICSFGQHANYFSFS